MSGFYLSFCGFYNDNDAKGHKADQDAHHLGNVLERANPELCKNLVAGKDNAPR